MDDGFSAGFDHHLCKCRPGTDTFATALRCLSKRLLAWAKWAGDVAGPISIVGIVLGHHVAFADEAGVSVWLPGTFGSLAAVPVQPGFQWTTTYYHATATSKSSTEFEEGGRIVRGLRPRPNLIQISPSYALATPVLGAQLGLAVTAVPAFVSNSITSTLTGPRGNSLSGSTGQSVTGFGDLYPRASLKWNENVSNFMVYGTGDIPVGLYSKDNIANIGTGHGAIDLGGGYTYLDRQNGNEVSAVAGLTYNFTNPTTNYQSGVDFHLDWAASRLLSEQVSAGVAGYVYQQIGCDSGSGNTVGCFRSRILGVGPQLGLRFPMGQMQGYVGLKAYGEFGAKNTPQGWNTWLTFAISPAEPTRP